MKILVAYASKYGSTAEIAHVIGDELSREGHEVELKPARDVHGLADWDAVVLGGALYMFRWYGPANRFVHRHVDELREMPAWFFSSGPLDDSAAKTEIPPVWSVRRLLQRVDGRGHITFGGKVAPDSPAAKRGLPVGDWRDMDRVRAWAQFLSSELGLTQVHKREPSRLPKLRRSRTLALALSWFTGITAVVGGLALMFSPTGANAWGMPLSLLEGTPFDNYFLPGLLLFGVVGLGNLAAAFIEQHGHHWSELAVIAGGSALSIWILVQMQMLQSAHFLQIFYLIVGMVTVLAAVRLSLLRIHTPQVAEGRQGPPVEA